MKILLTGATGYVGEGVLLSLLKNEKVSEIAVVGRREYPLEYPKVKQFLLKDFAEIGTISEAFANFDACFFCAGVSSVGKSEQQFFDQTYNVVLPFAKNLSERNPNMAFIYVSGRGTDSTEQGKTMWARVKGKTENDLLKLPFRKVYHFRPAAMRSVAGQKNGNFVLRLVDALYPVLVAISKNWGCTLEEVANAMVFCTEKGYEKSILEVEDIRKVGKIE